MKRFGFIARVFLFACRKVRFLILKYKKPSWGCAVPLVPLFRTSRRNICSSTKRGCPGGRPSPGTARPGLPRPRGRVGEARGGEGRGGEGKREEGRAGWQLLLAEPELVSCSLSPGCAQLRSLPTPRSVPQFPPPRGCGGEWGVKMGRASLGVGGSGLCCPPSPVSPRSVPASRPPVPSARPAESIAAQGGDGG